MAAKKRHSVVTIGDKDANTVNGVAPVVISASRSTDIPAFYAEWFAKRLKDGFVRWVNPFNRQPQYVSFANTRVIVFWSKNPNPLLPVLPELDRRGIHYYFQFTLNDYERENLEPHVPPLAQRLDTFRHLAELVGKKRVIWRFDPLILTDTLTVEVLVSRIATLATQIRNCTERLVVSFADIGVYTKVQRNLARENVHYREFTPDTMREVARHLQRIARETGLTIATCAEGIGLAEFGIEHNRCIDDRLMIELFPKDQKLMEFLGYEPDLFAAPSRPYLKDKGQRKECGCIVSKDIGMYDTCPHLCAYCYANSSCKAVEANRRRHRTEADSLVP
jgi:DNA repair photolyase